MSLHTDAQATWNIHTNIKNTNAYVFSMSSATHPLVCHSSVGVVKDPERCGHETKWL